MKAGRRAGYALLEVLFALVIVGFAIVAATAYAQARTTASLRLVAHQRVQTAIEVALESVRGGLVPLESGPFDLAAALPFGASELATSVEVEVRPTEIDDLFVVAVRASADAAGRPISEVVWTMVWRP